MVVGGDRSERLVVFHVVCLLNWTVGFIAFVCFWQQSFSLVGAPEIEDSIDSTQLKTKCMSISLDLEIFSNHGLEIL